MTNHFPYPLQSDIWIVHFSLTNEGVYFFKFTEAEQVANVFTVSLIYKSTPSLQDDYSVLFEDTTVVLFSVVYHQRKLIQKHNCFNTVCFHSEISALFGQSGKKAQFIQFTFVEALPIGKLELN
jgi:hypothetical protein